MAMGCENCTRTYNSEFFDSIDADSSDVEFQQIITFGCLSSLLSWAKNKHQLLKSSRSLESSDVGIPSLSSWKISDNISQTAQEKNSHNGRLIGGAVVQLVRHLGLRSVGRGFKSCSRQRCVTTLGKLFTPMCLCHQAVITWYQPKCGDALRLGR